MAIEQYFMLWRKHYVTKLTRSIYPVLVLLLLAACVPATPRNITSLILITPTLAAAAPSTQVPVTQDTRAGSAATPAAATATLSFKQWPAPPAMAIDPSKIYVANFKTAKGDVVVELLADEAPVTVNNFVFLAKQGFYDNTTFHRVLPGNFAQGGDPTATGTGGPGYSFADEFNPALRFEEPGLLAMANAGPDTNGSQFFITFSPQPQLTGRHSIFGKVIQGLTVAEALSARDPQQNPTGPGDALLTVTISEAVKSRLPPPTATPVLVAPTPAAGRPLAKPDVAQRENIFNSPPAMTIDVSKTYSATIKTTQGDVVIELYPADAPQSVNDFVVLANLGYWDGFPVNFATPGQFILTGSPGGQPTSDIGYTVPSEVKRPNAAGAVGLWYRTDRFGSSGSELYILLVASPPLDAKFTAFGSVIQGLDVVGLLTTADKIVSITVAEK
jgi:cyclophilin family peptidyl-prolyl cis-trans isomerase